MKISEMIEELEKIKEEHGDLQVKTWEYDDYYEDYHLDDLVCLSYYRNPDEDNSKEECVIIGE